MHLEAVTLHGHHVRLEPLTLEHVPGLWRAGADPAIWRWTTRVIRSEEEMCSYVESSLAAFVAGGALPFATVALPAGETVGSTGYWSADPLHRRVEIGGTWVAPSHQRTAVNTESKFLLLEHAFERLGCIRVEFKTHAMNARARGSLTRLGAREEGTLRNHMIQPDGTIRHSVYFSVVEAEWPSVRRRLEERLGR